MPKVKNKIKISKRIRDKSIEAYLLCIEIYNKPTIQYRIEASSYFICNAWELLLKAHSIAEYGEKSIYRPDGIHTFSLEEMLNKYFEDNSPVKKNLKFIIDKIRNKSTHLIIAEHDYLYTPFLQQAVLNYSKFLLEKFGINIADKVPFEYLALISRKELAPKAIAKLYSKNYEALFQDDYRSVIEIMQNTTNPDESIFAQISYTIAFTKNPKTADILAYYTTKEPSAIALKQVTVAKDIDKTHPYSMKQVIAKIKQRVSERGLDFNLEKLNQSRLSDFNKVQNIAKHPEFYNVFKYSTNNVKTYSEAYIDFIMESLEKDPLLFAQKNKG